MISRRNFLIGIGSCACHPAVGQELRSADSFLCAVVDTAPMPHGLDLTEAREGMNLNLDVGNATLEFQFTPYGTAFVRDIWTLGDGLTNDSKKITLGVHFVHAGEGQRAALMCGMSEWLSAGLSDRFQFEFDVPLEQAQVRVTFDTDMNWAAIGRNALKTEGPTLKLSDVKPTTVLHELGHVFGLQHEHRFPGAISWNRERVIADALKEFHWDAATTEKEILNKLGSDAVCLGDPNFNKDSVMNYPIPPNWAEYKDSSGRYQPLVIQAGRTISKGDVACLKGLYKL